MVRRVKKNQKKKQKTENRKKKTKTQSINQKKKNHTKKHIDWKEPSCEEREKVMGSLSMHLSQWYLLEHKAWWNGCNVVNETLYLIHCCCCWRMSWHRFVVPESLLENFNWLFFGFLFVFNLPFFLKHNLLASSSCFFCFLFFISFSFFLIDCFFFFVLVFFSFVFYPLFCWSLWKQQIDLQHSLKMSDGEEVKVLSSKVCYLDSFLFECCCFDNLFSPPFFFKPFNRRSRRLPSQSLRPSLKSTTLSRRWQSSGSRATSARSAASTSGGTTIPSRWETNPPHTARCCFLMRWFMMGGK